MASGPRRASSSRMSTKRKTDGDTLDWIAEQPWCDGNIGMTGESYYGSTQWAVAPLGHPNLKCLAPGNVDPDRYGAVHDGGALCLATAGAWAFEMYSRRYLNSYRYDTWHLPLATSDQAAGKATAFHQALIQHPSRDAYWDAFSGRCRYEDLSVPMMHWGGWWDVHINGTIEAWKRARESAASDDMRRAHWLVLGATDHELTPEYSGRIGRLELRDHGWTHDRVLSFMDRHLKWRDGFEARGRVRYFVAGANQWRVADDWPPSGIAYVKYYLHGTGSAAAASTGDGSPGTTVVRGAAAGGSLDTEPPQNEPADEYLYDPRDPVAVWVGRTVWAAAAALTDRREVEARDDVLVYTSETLIEPLEVTGPVCVTLHAASSARDTDFTAALVDVFPDGYAQLVKEGIVRARYRDSEREPSLLEPGRVYEYTIELGSVAYVVHVGHRLRVEVSSSDFDRYDRNQNTGGVYGSDARLEVARQRVLHDREHPSCLVLPVLSAAVGQEIA